MDALVGDVLSEMPSSDPLAHEASLLIWKRNDDGINLTRLDRSV